MTSSRSALQHSDIFVFGSNLAGRHGKGAALFARRRYGAVYGVGEGLTGQSYAIPTKDHNLRPLSIQAVERGILRFLHTARETPEQRFYLTPVGTGLAGHDICDIWAIVVGHGLPKNVVLAATWADKNGLTTASLLG